MKDPIIGRGLPAMRAHFRDVPVTETQAGHFLHEEAPEAIAAAVLWDFDDVQAARAPHTLNPAPAAAAPGGVT
jgi:haloalkane dehalogenase